MTGDGYQVLRGDLETHAAALDGLADDMVKALQAANAATLHGEAYGKICWFFVPVIQHVSEPCRTQLGEAGDTLRRAATEMRDTATGYQDTETGNVARLRLEGR